MSQEKNKTIMSVGASMFKKTMRVAFLSLLVSAAVGLSPTQLWAQAGSAAAFEEKTELTGTRKQLATIVFSGLAGAILGLSTLSFYGRPQDHLSNIAIGFAIGVIGGASYTTYKAATQPYGAYDLSQENFKKEFYGEQQLVAGFLPRVSWHWEF